LKKKKSLPNSEDEDLPELSLADRCINEEEILVDKIQKFPSIRLPLKKVDNTFNHGMELGGA